MTSVTQEDGAMVARRSPKPKMGVRFSLFLFFCYINIFFHWTKSPCSLIKSWAQEKSSVESFFLPLAASA